MGTDLSFCELRTKQVVNVIDGKVLGRVCDIIFSRETSRVIGVVVPGDRTFKIFNKKGDIFVPYDRIVRIGLDVVLVELKPYLPPHTEQPPTPYLPL
jgi:YlmC/YmxH family sporulation protein